MAGLPHYTQSRASKNKYEPVYKNLFEVTFLPPPGVSGGEILLEHVISVSGLEGINPTVDAVTQKFKFADRSYAGMPSQTYVDVSITFSLNLNESNSMYVYKTLQDWYKKIYNPLTGEMGLKKDYTGTIIIVQYNRVGDIYRKIVLKHAFPTGTLQGVGDYDYSSADPVTLSITFRSDHWDEELV